MLKTWDPHLALDLRATIKKCCTRNRWRGLNLQKRMCGSRCLISDQWFVERSHKIKGAEEVMRKRMCGRRKSENDSLKITSTVIDRSKKIDGAERLVEPVLQNHNYGNRSSETLICCRKWQLQKNPKGEDVLQKLMITQPLDFLSVIRHQTVWSVMEMDRQAYEQVKGLRTEKYKRMCVMNGWLRSLQI